MIKHTKIEILWRDAQTVDGWNDIETLDLDDECECQTIGYYINETKKFINVAQSISPDEYGNIWQIPKKMILKVNRLK